MLFKKLLSIQRQTSAPVVTSGTLWTWGDNSVGQVGDSSIISKSSPTQIGTSSWAQLTTGDSFTVAIKHDRTLWGWGQLPKQTFRISPVLLASGSWNSVAAGISHLLALKNDNTLWTMGDNTYGQLNESVNTTYIQSWSQVAPGGSHTIALRSDGALFAWGLNSNGQLGFNDAVSRSAPVQLGNFSWLSVSSGNAFSSAIRYDKTLWTWGLNTNGQLGINDVNSRSSPVQVGTSSWTQVSAGVTHISAIRTDGGLFVWGVNIYGQLGINDINSRSSPVQVGTSSWSQVSCGNYHTMAIKSDGLLYAIGGYQAGGGGLGDNTVINKSSPVQIGTSSWSQVSAGESFTAAIRSDGGLFTWGVNNSGQLGQNDRINKSSPVQVGTSSWSQVVVSYNGFSMSARKIDNTLWTWGNNANGRLGLNDTVNRSSPVQVGTSSWSQVAAGESFGMAIDNNNILYIWGLNSNGQLGQNDRTSRSSPVQVPAIPQKYYLTQSGTSSWSIIDASSNTSAAITSANNLYIWGDNRNYQIGDYTSNSKQYPSIVAPLSWTKVSKGSGFTLALRSDGTLFSWGNNFYGQLGLSDTVYRSSPVQVGTVGDSWKNVECGTSSVVALRYDNTLWTWGYGANGEIGLGTERNNKSSPVQIGTSTWTSIAAGSNGGFGIRSDGTLWAWGYNNAGQLGDNTVISRSSPVQIGTSSWTQVSNGSNATAAIRSDGALFTWGQNSSGMLGEFTTTAVAAYRSSPVQIGTSSWTIVSTSHQGQYMAAIDATGRLFVWGDNSRGKLGINISNTTGNRSSPVQVGSSSWTSVSVGIDHCGAIRSDGLLFSWGGNTYGQVGDGTTVDRSSPVQIGTSSWSQISYSKHASSNEHNSAGIDASGALYGWGRNTNGDVLGDNTVVTINFGASRTIFDEPTINNNVPTSWKNVSLGFRHTTAIDSNNKIYVWGLNDDAQLGLLGFDNQSWTQLATGETGSSNYTIGIKYDGTLWSWGREANGELGTDTTGVIRSSPVQIGNFKWKKVSTQFGHVLAIRSDDKLFAWGLNSGSQLGNGTTINRSSPVQIGTSNWSQISAGYSSSSAIRSDGALFTWGVNYSGQLGLGDRVNRSSPVQVGTSSWSQISLVEHALAIKIDGTLFSWGFNGDGKLGQNDIIDRSSPTQIGTSSWSQIYAAYYHSIGIRSDGALFTWGSGLNGRMGDNTTISRSSPIQIGTSSWSQVAGNYDVTYGIKYDGTLWGWGLNGVGGIGDGTTISRSSPVQIGSSLTWSNIFTGSLSRNSFSTTTNKNLYGWGINVVGVLGDNTTISRSSPVQIDSYSLLNGIIKRPTLLNNTSWTTVSSGNNHTMAIDTNSKLWGWGAYAASDNTNNILNAKNISIADVNGAYIRSDGALFIYGTGLGGSLGDNTTTTKSSPVQVGTSSWSQVSVGDSHVLAIKSDGTLWAWGYGLRGELGTDERINKSSPVQVGTSSWSQVACGFGASYAIKIDGGLYSWGDSVFGKSGQNSVVDRSSPVQIGTSSWSQVSSGGHHVVAIRSDGALFAWGDNGYGQLGQNNRVAKSSPVQIGTSSWTQVSAGAYHTAGIKIDSTLWTWGGLITNYGELGQNDTINRSSPVQVGTSSWLQVACGGQSTFALNMTGKLYAWGSNATGELGDNTIIDRSSPVQLGTESYFKIVASSINTGQGTTRKTSVNSIRTTGSLFVWGNNNSGQLGDNSPFNKSSPVQVGSFPNFNYYTSSPTQVGSLNYSYVSAGNDTTFAISSLYKLYGWGLNSSGQIGLGTQPQFEYIFSPTQIGTSDWLSVSAGGAHTGAIKKDV